VRRAAQVGFQCLDIFRNVILVGLTLPTPLVHLFRTHYECLGYGAASFNARSRRSATPNASAQCRR
jgi:hypothetical protein